MYPGFTIFEAETFLDWYENASFKKSFFFCVSIFFFFFFFFFCLLFLFIYLFFFFLGGEEVCMGVLSHVGILKN